MALKIICLILNSDKKASINLIKKLQKLELYKIYRYTALLYLKNEK